jgi:PAS domain S-box-containing protein
VLQRFDLLAKILESAPDSLVVVDPSSGHIEFANRQVKELLGYAPEELIGKSIEVLLPERFRHIHLHHRRDYAHAARVRPMGVDLDLYALRKDGVELPVEISLAPIDDEGQLMVAATLRDVTERKRVQNELKEARDAANRAREEAVRANQAKSRFLATASHDLRQPLQSLSLLNGALRRVAKDAPVAEAVAQQGQAIEAMSRLLNALLDISKLESGAIHPDPTDFVVAQLFEELRSEFSSLAAGKGLELRVEAQSLCAHSDPSLVGQILRNLVSNAIKYTRTGWVELRAIARPSTAVRVEVADTGVGIPHDQLDYIYEEFYQVGVASNTTHEGYGLGLAIVKRLVTLLGLKIEVVSEVGHGSVFAFELPAGVSPTASAPGITARAALTPASASQSILLVEDDPGVRNATSMLLKVEGYRVLSAGSLDEAMHKARDNPGIDLLVTDYHLADGHTGLDVIAAIRGILGEGMKVIMVTGDTSSAVRELAADPRMRLASKPVQPDELLHSVRELIPR